MTSYILSKSKTLSGKGTIISEESSRQKSRVWVLNCRVLRRPTSEYLNFKYAPPKGNYGNLIFSRNDNVIDHKAIEFPLQTFIFYAGNDGEIMRQIACVNQEILKSISNLGEALGLTVVSIENETKDWQSVEHFWDKCQYVAFSNTAMLFELHTLAYDKCAELDDEEPTPPPPPPPPSNDPAPVPPGTPVVVTPPEETDTPDTYKPDPLDDGYDGYDGTWTIRYANNGVVVVTKTYRGKSSDTFEITSPAAAGACDLPYGTKVIRNGTDIIEPVFNCNVDNFRSTIFDAVFVPD